MNALFSKVILPGIVFHFLIVVSGGKFNVTTTHEPLEAVIINGTRVEVTTVKIAEVSNHHRNSKNMTILKSITARHFTTSTQASRVILIPPANHTAQIGKRKKEHLT